MIRHRGLITALVIGCAIMAGCVLLQDVQSQDMNAAEWMRVLSNAALVPGVLLCGIGVLTVISGEGIFDAMKYTASAIWTHLKGGKKKYDSYYAYTRREHKQKPGMGFMIIPGAAFLIIALGFTGLYYLI